jgi:DNA (cytosine-5)-methyltransferase 1
MRHPAGLGRKRVTYRYISVFSGAGGFDLGMLRAGFKPGLVTAEPQAAYLTLKAAMPSAAVMNADVHDLLNAGTFAALAAKAPAALVIGQPPVPGSPSHGRPADPDGDAPQLMYRFTDVVAQVRPDAFIMAAPPYTAGTRWDDVMTRLRHTARTLGYDTFTPVLDAADYGTAQIRPRLFLIGMPAGCKPDPDAAPRTAGTVSAGTALRSLPAAVQDIACPAEVRLAPAPVLRSSPYASTLLAGPGRMLDLRKPAPVLPTLIGGNKTPVLDIMQLKSGDAPWIEGYHDYLYRLDGTPGKYGSEGKMRRLSLRECAALQGFPPDYPFRGAPLDRFKLAGSAVPPPLAEAVGRAVLAGLT